MIGNCNTLDDPFDSSGIPDQLQNIIGELKMLKRTYIMEIIM